MLSAGIKAPDFTLKDKDGKEVKLSSFLGRKVVLYFYPKDNTPGCTREACAFAGAYIGFKQRNVEVIGVSRDSEKSHANFAAKHELPFILLSDPELTAIQAYDVWKEKKLYGKVSMGVVRSTYVTVSYTHLDVYKRQPGHRRGMRHGEPGRGIKGTDGGTGAYGAVRY